MIRLRHRQQGFTIIELMIATAVFAVVLLLLSVGLLQIGRTYSKGVTTARTQEAARSVIDEISQAIQFGGGGVYNLINNGPSDGYCVGGKRFSYVLHRQLADTVTNPTLQSRHVLVADRVGAGACSGGMRAVNVTADPLVNPAGGSLTDPREMLGPRMRLTRLDVESLGPTSDLYRVTVRVVSGDSDLLLDRNGDSQINSADNPVVCRGERAGTQFCAVSELSTVVQKRVR